MAPVTTQTSITTSLMASAKARILIVDDDSDVLEAIGSMIEMARPEFLVRLTTNVNAALSILSEFFPDVILIDVKLGRERGFDVLTVAKQRMPHVSTIMMTAYRNADYAAEALRLGADDYLHKPLSAESVLYAIDRQVANQSHRREKEASDRRFRAIFERSNHLLFLIGNDGRIIDCNSVARQYLTDSKVADGSLLWSLNWVESAEMLDKRLQQSFDRLTIPLILDTTFQLRCDDGKTHHIQFSLTPVFDRRFTCELVIVEGRDLTEQIEAQEFLERAKELLEHNVVQRTLQLRLAKEAAEQASRAKTEFLSRMNHELRTPLNAVLGFAQLMEADGKLDPAYHHYVREILVAGKHLLTLINEVLDLARLDANRIQFTIEEVQISGMVAECIRFIEPQAKGRHLVLENRCTDMAKTLRADSQRLRQALSFLLDNAVKYNREGGSVAVDCAVAIGDRIRINVTDTGIGIHRDDIPFLFQPFQRLKHHAHVNGPGIGLNLVKRLVEAMGGTVGVESEFGKGSTFWIELPVGG